MVRSASIKKTSRRREPGRFALITKKRGRKNYASMFGIRLSGIGIAPCDEYTNYEKFATNVLKKQMDFIQSLHELKESFTVDLRYLFDPDEPCTINIYFLIQTSGD